MILTTAQQMKELDRATIEDLGVPSLVLMENAGRGVVQVIGRLYPHIRSAVVLAGKGNNGGDGFVIARYLHHQGVKVAVVLAGLKSALQGDAAHNARLAEACGVPLREISEGYDSVCLKKDLAGAELILDALLGTGLGKEVQGFYKGLIALMNETPRPKLAVDIPSGLSSDSGQPIGLCVQASATVTFGRPKRGHLLFPGSQFVGRLLLVDIGIPPALGPAGADRVELLSADALLSWLPERRPDSHKGTYGHALILAGSTGKTGAAALAAMGALRVGAGLVTLGVPAGLNPILEMKLTEAMTEPLPEGETGCLGRPALERIRALMAGKRVLALGPGLSTASGTQALIGSLLKEDSSLPLVIDADGLTALADHPEYLTLLSGRAILTPHPGEMARLTGKTVKEIQSDRITAAREFAGRYGVVLVLKGARTVVADPDGAVFLNPAAHPVMASGGMGDVLTGMITGWLAQGVALLPAACLGVYFHTGAGARIAATKGGQGILASELADTVPELIARPETWPVVAAPFLPLIQEIYL
jgi:ADP-dependent NAD(P)H-hydrate dehydratase / NAD(P)H-hydrate epimerase